MFPKLPEPCVQGLQTIQKEFDNYQSNAFEERSPQFFSLELCGETGELANIEKKIWRNPSLPLNANHLAEEAADVFISLINYCNCRKVNLEQAVADKLKIIEERRLQGKMGKIKNSK